jgi:hypothetical protein
VMDERFQPAQQALAAGDVEAMASLLAADPELATARSKRSHPTLLQCLVLTMPPVENLEKLINLLAAHGAELTGPLIAASGVDNLRAIPKVTAQSQFGTKFAQREPTIVQHLAISGHLGIVYMDERVSRDACGLLS